ncbi:MAG: SMEK domain-containing protein [Pirellulaceae bacterium]
MTRKRQNCLTEANDWLGRLELSIAGDIALRHQDSHIELEAFFRDLLNLVFDWNLANANTLFGKNQDSFDLSDEAASLAVQVTVTKNAKKIRKTLQSFVGTHDTVYQRLIFVYPSMTIPASRADFSEDLKGFDFDADRDRLGFGSILKKAQDFEIDKLERLIRLLRKELRPLGGQLGVEDAAPGTGLRTAYAKWMHQTSSTFFVPGLGVTMPIEDAWVRLKVLKDDKSIVGTKSSLDEQFQNYLEFGQRPRTADSDSTFASDSVPLTHPRTVLVGGPGDGKSTMLRRFAWKLSQEPTIVVRVRLPIVLRNMLAGRSFEEAVRMVGFDGSGIGEADAARLLNSADFLLCDGLDECDSERAQVAEQIIRWSVGHSNCRICVATRPVGHEAAFLPEFTHFAIQPPDEHQVQELSRKLFEKAGANESYVLKWAGFLKSIDSKSEVAHIRKLASRNPLLLGFLIRLSLDDVEIGKTRSELYAHIFGIIARTMPNDREATDVNERVASEVANVLAWKQTLTPFCSSSETLRFVSEHLRTRFDLDTLSADEAANSGLQFWEDRRLVETLSVGNDAKTFFVHLSLQEFAAARYARDLKASEFVDWIRHARRKGAWKQVILLLSGIDDDARTTSALLDIDDPRDPVSREALLAAEAVFEREPPDLTALPRLLQSLATRFDSNIPLVSIEATQQLARVAPYAKQEVLAISRADTQGRPWMALGSLLLRLLTDDANEVVEEFKVWFKDYQPVAVHFPKIGSRDEAQLIPEEGRELQNQIIECGTERIIESHDTRKVSKYFNQLGAIGNLSVIVISNLQQRLTDIGLEDTAKALWPPNFDNSQVLAMQRGFERWDQGRNTLLRLVLRAAEKKTRPIGEPPYLKLSMLWSALQVWESPGSWLTTLVSVEPDTDVVGCAVIRALASALDLDVSEVGGEAQAVLDCCQESGTRFWELVEHASVDPDWSKLTPCDVDPRLIAEGVLHPAPYIGLTAARAIRSGFAKAEAAQVIPRALESRNEHAIWYAAALAKSCLGDDAFTILLSRLDRPISADHKCLFREIARLCGHEHRHSAVTCFFAWLGVDNPELATGIAEYLIEFDPPLGEDIVDDLRNMYAHWTERGTRCERDDTVVKGSSCPHCSTVPPSPRSALLKELNRLGAVPFEELVELCGDPRHDVSDLTKSIVIERAAADTNTFSDVLDRVESDQLTPRILDKLLKLPIKRDSPIAQRVERLVHGPDLKLRLATLRQLTGEWIDREQAVAYLRSGVEDPEPTIRTLATRVLRLLD